MNTTLFWLAILIVGFLAGVLLANVVAAVILNFVGRMMK